MRCRPIIPRVRGKIALVGEAPGQQEDIVGYPFVGESGRELQRMCTVAGIPWYECLVTNVFMDRPPGNRIEEYCCPRQELPKDYYLPPLSVGKYIKPEYLFELDRLKAELEEFQPNVIVPLGATALWAVCQYTQIGKYRGAVQLSKLVPGVKVVPTWHPANVLRVWSNRVVVIVDLMKAKRESEYPEIRVMRREVVIEPTLMDLYVYKKLYLDNAPIYSVDIETAKSDIITCIGVAPAVDKCLVVPFVDKRKIGYNYWETPEEELCAWKFLIEVLTNNPATEILGQNFLYDLYHMLNAGLHVPRYRRDTMLKHHAYEPEMTKDLGFMGSIYADEVVWKQQRPRRRKVTMKRED